MDIQTYEHKQSDTRLLIQRAGTAERAILLIHGFLSSTFSWRFLFPLLSPYFTVYAVDLPGFGRSDKGRHYPYTLTAYAKSIHNFIQAEGIQTLTLMAHSMGGQVALRLAKLAPENVDRLVLIASSGYLPAAKRWHKLLLRLPFSYSIVPRLITKKRVDQQLNAVYYNLKNIDIAETYEGYLTPLRDPAFPRALFKFARSRESDLSSDMLQQIEQPTLLIWGRYDRIIPLRIGERLLQDLPDARLEVIEEAGHVPMEEKPLDVMHRIAPFLDIPAVI